MLAKRTYNTPRTQRVRSRFTISKLWFWPISH